MSSLEDLDPVYFSDLGWTHRLGDWLATRSEGRSFLSANADAVELIAQRRDLGLRMAVNIPAYALLCFLRESRYRNAYERPPDAGKKSGPSPTRREVDAALFPPPARPEEHYFGAAVLGGTGVRYYGEYCLVLKEDEAVLPEDTQVLDRNSYDAKFPPLAGLAGLAEIFKKLRGQWGEDVLAMVKLKILPELGEALRLATSATASELLLHDESFVEVHKRGTFGPADVHEVRESPADASVEADLTGRRQRGEPLASEESIWLARRHRLARALGRLGLRTRIIVTTGRMPR